MIRTLLAAAVAAVIALPAFGLPAAVETSVSAQQSRSLADRKQPVTVRVGGYPFEPFVENGLGVTPAFLTLLNGLQADMQFEFVQIPAQRRYELLRRGTVDAIFFEMPVWGWQDYAEHVEITEPILRGTEVFVALRETSEGKEVFRLAPDRKIALTLGYHYAFADFNADQSYIRTKVDAVFAERISQTLRYLRSGAVDVAVMSDLFLYREYQRTPALQGQLFIGPKPDHDYALPLLVRSGGPVSANDLDTLMEKMRVDGSLTAFFGGFGLDGVVIQH